MSDSSSIRQRGWTCALGTCLLLACAAVLATERSALPRVIVIGTGGTIAGAAASSTEFHDYKSGKVAVQALIDAIPGLRNAVDVRSESSFRSGAPA